MEASAVAALAGRIVAQRYPSVVAAFAAGSVVRGEGTAYSDLDLVVVFNRLDHAYRESFRHEGVPVEAFVHDEETLKYFILDVDRRAGVPTLAQMVAEGIAVPGPNAVSRALKRFAKSVIDQGPPALDPGQVDTMRYGVTDLVDDLRDPRSPHELVATGTRLYKALADFHLRSSGHWSGDGKALVPALRRANESTHDQFVAAFDDLFCNGDPTNVIALAEDMLKPHGGFLFAGYRLNAPREWRRVDSQQ